MRPALFSRNQKLYCVRDASTRRAFSTSLPNASSSLAPICQICNRNSPRRTSQPNPQRRWVSQSSTGTSQSISDAAIRANPIPQTHYEFFPKTLPSGPPPKGPFKIDFRELRKEFLQLQAVAHPDRHPSHLKNRADATSARINEAYKCLQNPLLRTQYLLSLRGINVEDESAKVEDPELLMEVLDTREEIENARGEEELVELKQINDERIEASEKVLDQAFREDDMEAAKGEAVRLRYWINIKESLDGWEKGRPVVLDH